jgi:hypothetical protein
VAALKDQDAQYAAREALARGGHGVVAALAAGMADADAEIREACAVALAKIGPLAAAEASPALRKALRQDPEQRVRDAVEKAIRAISAGE